MTINELMPMLTVKDAAAANFSHREANEQPRARPSQATMVTTASVTIGSHRTTVMPRNSVTGRAAGTRAS